MWQIRLEKGFQKSFKSLDRVTQKRITKFLVEIRAGLPSPAEHPHFKYLHGAPGYGRFRIGSVLATLQHLGELGLRQ